MYGVYKIRKSETIYQRNVIVSSFPFLFRIMMKCYYTMQGLQNAYLFRYVHLCHDSKDL